MVKKLMAIVGLAALASMGYASAEKPNEMGLIMVLEYHRIGKTEGRWQRTPDNFRRNLELLYKEGYRSASLRDVLVEKKVDTAYGYKPVILTFDDGSVGQCRYIDGKIDPDSAVGILESFYTKHPDFGLEATFFVNGTCPFSSREKEQKKYCAEKVKRIINSGMDVQNHTVHHPKLWTISGTKLEWELGKQVEYIHALAGKDYVVDSFALPYGSIPRRSDAKRKLVKGYNYENKAIFLVGSTPTVSPFDKRYRFDRIPRIQVFKNSIKKWINRLRGKNFVSDGDPGKITR